MIEQHNCEIDGTPGKPVGDNKTYVTDFPTFLAGFILGTNPYVRPISGAVGVREKSLTGIKRAFADVTGILPGRDHWAGAHLVGCGT
jgi:hypothetical protein